MNTICMEHQYLEINGVSIEYISFYFFLNFVRSFFFDDEKIYFVCFQLNIFFSSN